MGIGRLVLFAIGLSCFTSLAACEPYRRAKECRVISDLVNPTLRAIDAERTKRDDAPAYARIAILYDTLSGKLLSQRYSSKRLSDAVAEYARLLSDASRDARVYSDALVTKDPARTAIARAAAGHTLKRENTAILRIDGACTK